MKHWLRRIGQIAMAIAFACKAAAANESLSELTHRGADLSAVNAAGLVVEAMNVSIGVQVSSLKYRVSNPTTGPVSTTVTIPLPELDFSDPDTAWSIPGPDPVNFVSMTARVDRKPASLVFAQVARLGAKDVSAALRRDALPLVPLGAFQGRLASLSSDAKARLARDGLIAEVGTDPAGNPLYFPRWSVRTSASYKLELAAGQSVELELRFRTSVGVTRDSVLREPLRSEKALAREVEQRRVAYCFDRGFVGGVDKIVSAAAAQLAQASEQTGQVRDAAEPQRTGDGPTSPSSAVNGETAQPAIRLFPTANVANLQEKRISFDFGADASEMTVRQFRLSVDKGKPTRLVSFCLENLRKISPTSFEMRATDFRPSGLFKILLVGSKD